MRQTLTEYNLTAIAPLDGRYASKTAALQAYFSEYALIKHRVIVEIRWFMALANHVDIHEVPNLSSKQHAYLESIIENFSVKDAQAVKNIEKTTNHDVKAVEYWLKQQFEANAGLTAYKEFIHFACTSADINNLAYGLMLKGARQQQILPNMQCILTKLAEQANQYADCAMLARTHGQAATPTTMGKELANHYKRLQHQLDMVNQVDIRGKINGAVGNYNAHVVAYPDIDWPQFSQHFVENLGLQWNAYTAQIEQHDYIAELFDAIVRFNTILVDLSRDIWGYISLGYFKQKTIAGEVGSSTMPHKVNPIDFENAEGNMLLANAQMTFLARQLVTSRWQRDLVDSTLMRNVGVGIGHSFIAYQSLLKGLNKLEINQTALEHDLEQHWGVLAEAIQTVMRRYNIPEPYEKLKALTRGKAITDQTIKDFVRSLELPDDTKQALLALTPQSYTGLASILARTLD